MTPHKQLITHDPANGQYGDCHRTCIAVILDLHPSEVPHFMDGEPDNSPAPEAGAACSVWLASHGFAEMNVPYLGEMGVDGILQQANFCSPTAPMILGGQSRMGVNHSVVVMGGEIVCDPSGNGIVGPMDDGMFWLTGLTVGPSWGARGDEGAGKCKRCGLERRSSCNCDAGFEVARPDGLVWVPVDGELPVLPDGKIYGWRSKAGTEYGIDHPETGGNEYPVRPSRFNLDKQMCVAMLVAVLPLT